MPKRTNRPKENLSQTNGLRFAPQPAPAPTAAQPVQAPPKPRRGLWFETAPKTTDTKAAPAEPVPSAQKPRRGLWFAPPAEREPESIEPKAPARQPVHAWEMTLEQFQQTYFPELFAKQQGATAEQRDVA